MNSLSTQQDENTVVPSGKLMLPAMILALALAGCATAVKPRSAEEIVKERSQARWTALVKSDLKTAYGFFSPGSRAVLSYEDYVTSIRRGFWKSAVVEKVTCSSPDVCEALVTIEYEFQRMVTKSPVRESWIREGSDWWYVQK